MFFRESRHALSAALLAFGVATAMACATGSDVFGAGDEGGDEDDGQGGEGGTSSGDGSDSVGVGLSGPGTGPAQGSGGGGGDATTSTSAAQSSSAAQSTAASTSAMASSAAVVAASSSSGGMGGDCCMVNAGPGCNDPGVEACVCAADSFCCNNSWDQTCVDEVDQIGCGSCGGGGGGMCCVESPQPGCSDPAIEACVCAFDSFCCMTAWDLFCVDEVTLFGCGVCP